MYPRRWKNWIVLDVIRDPEFLGSNASKLAKVATVSKTTHVIDLADD